LTTNKKVEIASERLITTRRFSIYIFFSLFAKVVSEKISPDAIFFGHLSGPWERSLFGQRTLGGLDI
jgi:hypothetical protein